MYVRSGMGDFVDTSGFPAFDTSAVNVPELPCVAGQGPLRPGQAYCQPANEPNPAGPVADYFDQLSIWLRQNKMLVSSVGVGLLVLALLRGRR